MRDTLSEEIPTLAAVAGWRIRQRGAVGCPDPSLNALGTFADEMAIGPSAAAPAGGDRCSVDCSAAGQGRLSFSSTSSSTQGWHILYRSGDEFLGP